MIINQLDLGTYASNADIAAGGTIGSQLVEGSYTAVWHRGAGVRKRTETVFIQAQVSIGGFAAKSQQATQLLLTEILELASNPGVQPALVQFASGAGVIAIDPRDGWYLIDNVKPTNEFPWSGIVAVQIELTFVAYGPPRSVAYSYVGGALSSNFSGPTQPLLGYPLNSANTPSVSTTRAGSEGAIPVSISPSTSLNPVYFSLSATISDWYKGGCHVYDTMVVGGNAVPAAPAATNAAWVEVLGTDHDFVGDCIVTNGLHLYRFQTGVTAQLCLCYVWSTAQATPGWLQFATVVHLDNSGNTGALRYFSLQRVGTEEVRVVTTSSTVAGNWVENTIRLQRGQYFGRIDLRPLTQASTTTNSLYLNVVANPKIVYNSGSVTDNQVGGANLTVQSDYGYAACFVNSSAQPFICGWLYQNQPSTMQPQVNVSTGPGLGDTGPAQNVARSYGMFCVPYGSATDNVQRLQAEAESGTLGTGWTSQAGAGGNSNALEAKCASGTLSGNADLWGTAFVPPPGVYDLWVRMKVTATASGVAQMQVGLWNSTDSVFFVSTTYAPSQLTTTYVWYRVATGVTPSATKNMQVRAVTTGTLATDFFIDESALVPISLFAANTGPQDVFQQFQHDRMVRMIRG